MRVEIGPLQGELHAPADPMLCHDVVVASADNRLRAFVAALGLCLRGLTRPPTDEERDAAAEAGREVAPVPVKLSVSLKSCRYNVLEYGGRVFTELNKLGASPAAIQAMGIVAFNAMAEQSISSEDLADAEGKSPAAKAAGS